MRSIKEVIKSTIDEIKAMKFCPKCRTMINLSKSNILYCDKCNLTFKEEIKKEVYQPHLVF